MESHNLKELRTGRKLSLNALAKATGIALSTLGEIERYKTPVKPHQVRALCEYFGITEDEFWK